MVDSARAIVTFVSGVPFESYRTDRMRQRAVEREVEIIGAAARKLTEAFRADHPHIPWRSIIAQRNLLAHEYGEIDPERIWRLAVQDIPQLLKALESLLARKFPKSPR
ncbi:MAG: DUF86 domain-containing protein [Rhodospirillales bacterium]|nr:DUF86 domain-containing protein [Rhodospirillales bacterium]